MPDMTEVEHEETLCALRLAEPWLVMLGDLIGNGTRTDPEGRTRAVLAVRRAIRRMEATD